ncbi:MAG: hypothetical protein RLZZ628_3132 [Bacteroidota bacterium]|jgi:hypothetical protein
MTIVEIIKDCEFFTAGILECEKDVFVPFFQNHENGKCSDESAYVNREGAVIRLAEILIEKLDEICDDVDLESTGDYEPSVSLIGGTLPHKEEF